MRPRLSTPGLACIAALLSGCFAEAPPVGSGTAESASADETGSTASTATDTTSMTTTSTPTGTVGTGSSSSEPTTGEASDSSTSAGASSETSTVLCGDGVVDDHEMCDGGMGCDDACELINYACNPLNDAGCPPGMRCGLVDFESETFACMNPGSMGEGEACASGLTNDGDCGVELTCIFHGQTLLCDAGDCCVRYCNLGEGISGCSDQEVCAQFFPTPMYEGLEHLGFCYS